MSVPRCMTAPRDPSIFVHPTALCESDRIGPRTRVWAFAHVMKGAVIGADCNICDHAFIEGGAVVGNRVIVKNNTLIWDKVTIADEAFIGPNAVFTNDINPRVAFPNPPERWRATSVERGATIGANSTIVCGVTIREQAFIGAGSVVVRDVPAYALIVGNPARRIGWMCACGTRISGDLRCSCGRRYRLLDNAAGLALLTSTSV